MLLEGAEVRKSVSLVFSPLGDELLIYDSASGNVHVLNKTAHQVWKWLDEGIGSAEMVNRFCDAYAGVTPEAADRLNRIGVDVKWTTPAEMRDWVDSQLKHWGNIAKTAGIVPQ